MKNRTFAFKFKGGASHKPCGLSWQQQREPEWRCVDVECEQRFLEYEHEHRFSSEQQSKGNFNRRTTPGTCPHRGAEGGKPQ